MSREAGAASGGSGGRNPRNNAGPRESRRTGVAGRVRDPEQAWSTLVRLAGRYAGYFTTRTVVRAECEDLIPPALDEGRVLRIRVGLMRLGDWQPGPMDDYAMWSAWFDGAAAVSHHSAAELHGVGRLRPRFVHMTAPGGRLPSTPGLVVLRRALRRSDVESAGAFLVTTPLRTILDLADSGIGQIALDEVVSDAVAILRCDGDEIYTAAAALPERAATRLRRSVDRA